MQLTPLNERHTTDAFSLNVFRQQKHGSNGTLVVILNCIEHPSHFEKKRPVRGEAVGTYFTKLATSRENYICLLFISSSGRILYFQPARLTASESPNYLSFIRPVKIWTCNLTAGLSMFQEWKG